MRRVTLVLCYISFGLGRYALPSKPNVPDQGHGAPGDFAWTTPRNCGKYVFDSRLRNYDQGAPCRRHVDVSPYRHNMICTDPGSPDDGVNAEMGDDSSEETP